MFVFNKLNRFICIRLSNANKIQTINPEIMNKTTRLLGSLLIITIATSCGTGGKNQSAQTDDPLANSPIVGQYVQAGTAKKRFVHDQHVQKYKSYYLVTALYL